MSILFGGGEMGAFIPSDNNAIESITSGRFDSGFARCGIYLNGIATYADSYEWASGVTDAWFHGECYVNSVGIGGDQVLGLLNSSGTEIFRLYVSVVSGGLSYQMKWNNAGVWTAIGSAFTIAGGLETFDINLVTEASGSATIYVAGTERATGTANLSALTDVAQARPRSSNQVIWSQVVCAEESTIGYRLRTVPATAAGATTDWTGGYTEIDEIVYSDADFVNSATANQVELFAHSTAVPAGYRVKAVIVTARAKRGSASGPQNIQLALRSGGTTYFSASQAVGLGYGAHVAVWESDPATAAAFTASAIASLQFGVKSIA